MYSNKKIYIHGLVKGQKIDNIQNNSKVCFEIDKMKKFLLAEVPCDVNTEYVSAIIMGEAKILNNEEEKTEVLKKIVKKHVPSLVGREFSKNMLKATGVIEISVIEWTGKFYK